MRIVGLLVVSTAGCIYPADLELDSDERFNCAGLNWCDPEFEHCGEIIVERNTCLVDESVVMTPNYIGLESDDKYHESPADEDSIYILCADDTRLIPVCTGVESIRCDGQVCQEGFACAYVRFADGVHEPRCVELPTGPIHDCLVPEDCPAAGEACAAFITFSEESMNGPVACVDPALVQPR